MKSAVVVTLLASLLIVFGGIVLIKNTQNTKTKDSLLQIFDYLKNANGIRISKVDFDVENKSILKRVSLESVSKEGVSEFMRIFADVISNSKKIATNFSPQHIFTPDYKVELDCASLAVIDFVFYESMNSVCLKNKDCYLFAQFSENDAERLKAYFEK